MFNSKAEREYINWSRGWCAEAADRLRKETEAVEFLYAVRHDQNYDMIRHLTRNGMSRRRLVQIYGEGAVRYSLDPPAPPVKKP
jgi:hypothetical protein